jgi:dihydroflavonol-4-reductase
LNKPKKRIYIVTGATGFVGSHVVRMLEQYGQTVICMARDRKKAEKVLAGVKGKIIYGDILEKEKVASMFTYADKTAEIVVIHTAAVVYLGRNRQLVREMYKTNIEGTKNVIDCCVKYKCRLVHVSSVHAIPEGRRGSQITEITDFNPKKVVGHYAKTKAMTSALVMNAVREKGLSASLVHPSGILGPTDPSCTHMTQMVHAFFEGRIPAGTSGGYDFVDVRDVATGIIVVANSTDVGECYLLTNRYYTVRELYDAISAVSGIKPIKIYLPRVIVKASLPFVALQNKIKKRRPLFTAYSLYTLGSNSNFSRDKATDGFGYAPRSLEESLRDMHKEYMEAK